MKQSLLILSAAGIFMILQGCELPPVETSQLGFRGTGAEHVANPSTLQDSMDSVADRIPTIAGAPDPDMEPAPPGTWENVQYLGHLSEAEFNRTMLALTTWVAQETGEGCNYCHVIEEDGEVNFASDDIYTKVVSRDMIRMTQDLNANYPEHVGERGVNCWTCHMGEVLPNNYWFYAERGGPDFEEYYVNEGERQTERYLLDQEAVRVISDVALSGDSENTSSIQDTEYTYWVMMEMSKDLGVNCTYCHTTGRFSDWDESPPQRVSALRGVRMVRHANAEYMLPLQDAWPDNRLGSLGDGPKIQCATCHNGAFQPQYGVEAGHATDWPAFQILGPPHEGAAPDDEADGL